MIKYLICKFETIFFITKYELINGAPHIKSIEFF